MRARKSQTDLPEALWEIARMDRAECRQEWIKVFKCKPPKYLSVQFMQRMLAHDVQCRRLGGHSAASRRALRAALAGDGSRESVQTMTDGATLVREWNGRIYRVIVSQDGYLLDGMTYASLSAVAKHITGAHWSGPRFFGLDSKRSA